MAQPAQKSDKPDPQPLASNDSAGVLAQFRELGKWIFTSLSIVFTVLIAGITFSSFSSLDPSKSQFFQAIFGSSLTLFSIGFITLMFARLLAPFLIIRSDFEEELKNNTSKKYLDGSMPTRYKDANEWLEIYKNWETKYQNAHKLPEDTDINRVARNETIRILEDERQHLLAARAAAIEALRFCYARKRYTAAIWSLGIGGVAAITGVIIFATSLRPITGISALPVFKGVQVAKIIPSDAGAKILAALSIRSDCIETNPRVLIVSSDKESEYFTLPKEKCPSVRFVWNDTLGEVELEK